MLGTLVVVLGWLAWRGLEVRRELESARSGASEVKDALLAGDVAQARAQAREVAAHADEARRLSSGPVWRAAQAVPVLGDTLAGVSGVAEVADRVASRAVPDLLESAAAFDLQGLRPAGDTVAVERLTRARPALTRAAAELDSSYRQVRDLRELTMLPPVADAVADLDADLAEAREVTRDVARATVLVPPMLGSDEPRRYFLAFQNNAEARGTGGLLGAYGILEARDGRLSVRHMGPNTELADVAADLPVPLGDQFRDRYGDDPALWVNANMSPHFPYAARIWLALWERQTGERLDGVLATDPVALGYVLGATGPVTLPDGAKLTGDNAARMTMSKVYARYPGKAQGARDLYLQQMARASFDRLFSGTGRTLDLVRAMTHAADEGRLLVYSTHPAEERLLSDSVVGGALSNEPGPRVAVVVNNGSGGKLDYYLDRTVRYERLPCAGDRQRSKLTVTLRNAAPKAGLPTYVTARVDRLGLHKPQLAGHDRVLASVFLPMGSEVLAGTMDGGPLRLVQGHERGRPTADFTLDLAPGESGTVVLHLDEPAAPGKGQVDVQPLVRPADVSVVTSEEAATCAG